MKFSRIFAMPNANTFSIKPIGAFVQRYLAASVISIDPFARDCAWASHTNDLNPETAAQPHEDAETFLLRLRDEGVLADLIFFDPPYSPRQISECYKKVGREVGMAGTQNAALYSRVRNAVAPLCAPGAIVLSFGWNTNGMGLKHRATIEEILLVAHGGGHNDTICMAEKMP